ncbi:hypothetical protein HNQ85_003051 [Anoxybacillus calidus]|uniref:YtkA-like domain-containing protein n=1 Tax=[Anoxybacillus] calidus TaxID=575178 RepID=A0A7W0BY52_9BACL|nr:hypothetical protein [Anoxybacillus calidus]
MNRKSFLAALVLMIIIGILSSCAQKNEENEEAEELAFLDVKIQTEEKIELNKETEIACLVTYGKEKVTDADEVKFEIWKNGEENHEMLLGEHRGEGKYSVKKTFTEPGTYSIVAHVTARSMHNMPKKEITVGENQTANSENRSKDKNEHEGEHHGHHHSHVMIAFRNEQTYQINTDIALIANVQTDHQPLSEAQVKFEVWKENAQKHEFIDAKEGGNGEYKAVKKFTEPGIYFVKIHVQKGDIHEHQVEKIVVQ